MVTGYGTGGSRELWRSMKALWNGWRRKQAVLGEIDALDSHERGRILAEAGMTREQLAQSIRLPYASDDLLTRAVASLGIDADVFYARHVLWHRDMEWACAACPARSRCRRDLATGDFARRYRHYCPNSRNLAELAAENCRAGLSMRRAPSAG